MAARIQQSAPIQGRRVPQPSEFSRRRLIGQGMLITAGFSLLTLVNVSPAEETIRHNQVLSIGDAGPTWRDLPGVDGQTHSLKDFDDQEVLVVVFTCNSCPYAVDYQDRMIELTRKYAPRKVGVVAINVNKVPEDRLEAMKATATEKGFNFPYLYDETQQIAKDYGASFTPEFFVLNRQRRVVYMGAMDDDSDPEKAQVNYVAVAIEATLNGQSPSITTTVPVGCRIRWARVRRGAAQP